MTAKWYSSINNVFNGTIIVKNDRKRSRKEVQKMELSEGRPLNTEGRLEKEMRAGSIRYFIFTNRS